MNEQKTFEQLLQELGLSDSQKYFAQSPEGIAQVFGFTGQQAENLGQFFQPVNQQQYLDAFNLIGQGQRMRTGQLIGDTSAELGQLTSQVMERAGASGFTGSGATMRDLAAVSGGASANLGRGLYDIGQQTGRERSALSGQLTNYVTGLLEQARRIQQLDPTSQNTVATSNPYLDEIQEIMDNNPGMTRQQAEDMFDRQFDQQGLDQGYGRDYFS